MSKEDRLAYYREKYGEDFGGDKPREAAQAQRPRRDSDREQRRDRPRHDRPRERQGKLRHDDSRQRDGRKPRPEQAAAPQNQATVPENQQAGKKPGLLRKIMNFFKGK